MGFNGYLIGYGHKALISSEFAKLRPHLLRNRTPEIPDPSRGQRLSPRLAGDLSRGFPVS